MTINHPISRAIRSALLLCGLCLLVACSRTPQTEPIRYDNPDNWVLLPETGEDLKPVDVFYVYPTVVAHNNRPLMSWTNDITCQKTEHIARQQSGIFASYANVYAPYCRQLEFHRAWAALTGPDAPDYAPMEQGILDIRDAFNYYMEHFNQGRPFILLGYSQGAMDLFFLMKDEFEKTGIPDQLIAAYLIGMSIRPEDVRQAPHLRFAAASNDTGVIITYNTELADTPESPFATPGAFCINPLNWSTADETASASLNLGAVFFDGQGRITNEAPGFCSARLDPDRGTLVVSPTLPGTYDAPDILGTGITHMNDIYLFYRNLEENGRQRIAAISQKGSTD